MGGIILKLAEVIEILELDPLVPGDEEMEITTACGADLMSDVLAFSPGKSLLLTGLTNPQVIRTVEMIDINIVIFVRGKRPIKETIDLAREKGIYLYLTAKPLFECCGLLYERGLRPEEINELDI